MKINPMANAIHYISNQLIRIQVAERGAELCELFHIGNQLNYLWKGDPVFWGKTSPVLFPIVGSLRNNAYRWQNKTYSLPRHGFARELPFQLIQQSENTLLFQLVHSAATLAVYPFPFKLSILYHIDQTRLSVRYQVENPATSPMYFSIGAHPAFALPLEPQCAYNDYYLAFSTPENAPIYPLTESAFIANNPKPFFHHTKQLSLYPELFYGDALVFKNLQSNQITLAATSGKAGLQFNFPNTPYFGIWSAKNAPFICLEPWHGIADTENATGNLEEKEGIITLFPGNIFSSEWSVTLF
ncbi:MAG: aldose 1-epimerase family protein [Chitinophagia bacterium]|nr:aldose 1-epimerase family protein [Chitinophagia bacterium]